LPEVPSCRHNNFPKRFNGFDFSDDEDEFDKDDRSGRSSKVGPELGFKSMANALVTEGILKFNLTPINTH
jgi:hypothetical protein